MKVKIGLFLEVFFVLFALSSQESLACGKKCHSQTTSSQQVFKVGGIMIREPWARSSTGTTSAVFMKLKTDRRGGDILLGAQTDVCERVELHAHVKEGDVMAMRPVQNIPLSLNRETILKPGSLHIMLIGLKKPLQKGEIVLLQLNFKNAGNIKLEIPVKPVNFHPDKSKEHCHCLHKGHEGSGAEAAK